MAWLRIGDTLFSASQILALGRLKVPCMGLYVLCYTWAAANPPAKNGDPDLVPVRQAKIEALDCPIGYDEMINALEAVGLVARRRRRHKVWGECLEFIVDDDLLHIFTTQEQDANRNRHIANDLALRILARDGDQCRWCGITVNPYSRRGGQQRHFDHIDPSLPHSVENTAVACHTCNQRKSDLPATRHRLRPTPAEQGIPLHLHEDTRINLEAARLIPSSRPMEGPTRPARPMDDLRDSGAAPSGDNAPSSTAPTKPRPNPDRYAGPGVGREGQARVGSGPRRRGGRRHSSTRGQD